VPKQRSIEPAVPELQDWIKTKQVIQNRSRRFKQGFLIEGAEVYCFS